MTAVEEAVVGCHSLFYSPGSTSGSSQHRQQRSCPANATHRRGELAGVRSPPQLEPHLGSRRQPRRCYSGESLRNCVSL